MVNMVELDGKIRSEINAICKYANRNDTNTVNIEALIVMVEGLLSNLKGQRPNDMGEKK